MSGDFPVHSAYKGEIHVDVDKLGTNEDETLDILIEAGDAVDSYSPLVTLAMNETGIRRFPYATRKEYIRYTLQPKGTSPKVDVAIRVV